MSLLFLSCLFTFENKDEYDNIVLFVLIELLDKIDSLEFDFFKIPLLNDGKLSLFKSVPSRLIEKSAYCSTENMATNKFDVVFSYCGDNIKEFILLLPYNKSLEMYELNDQKIQYLTAPNINIHKMSLSNITI